MTLTHNPKAPHPPRVVLRPTVPAPRLRRLGATQRALDVYRAWWESLDLDGQRDGADRLAVLTDAQLAEQVEVVADLADAPARDVTSWVRAASDTALAAALAAAAERQRPKPRPGLLRDLEGLS